MGSAAELSAVREDQLKQAAAAATYNLINQLFTRMPLKENKIRSRQLKER